MPQKNALKKPPTIPLPVKDEEDIPSIPDTPENVARAILSGRPKKVWDYLKKKPK